MDALSKQFRRIGFVLRLPEVQIFWVLLPLLVGVFILAVFNPPVPARVSALIIAGLLGIIAFVVFFASYRLARTNFDTKVERNELKHIIETMNDALVVYDQEFKVLFFNPAAEKLFALSADEVLDTELKPQIADDPRLRLLAQIVFPSLAPTLTYRSKAGTYPQIVDISFTDPFLELRVITSPIIDEHSRIASFMKIIENRTQEASLMQSKNEFIAVASHQLRTPITKLNWALETLQSDPTIPVAARDLVAQTNDVAKKILTIVEDLLNITKIEEGHFGYDFKPTDMVQFLDEVLSAALPQVERAGLKLYFDRPAAPLPFVTIDPQKLAMVLSNLIDNAVRYNVQHGQVTVRARRADDARFAEVSVKDSGIGIPPEEVKKIFTKFFRATNAVKFQTDGSGLGLWIARNIIRAHGGEMWAESEVNRGTTFFFTLPVDPSVVPPKEVANTPMV